VESAAIPDAWATVVITGVITSNLLKLFVVPLLFPMSARAPSTVTPAESR